MGRIHPTKKKFNRFERQEHYRQKLAYSLAGAGKYVFKNPMKGTYCLPKAGKDANGKDIKNIPPGGEFIGDSYFLKMVKSHELRLVRVLEEPTKPETPTPAPKQEVKMNEETLIVDQPDRITVAGKIEQVVKKTPPAAKLNEQPSDDETNVQQDVLINENPLDGVEIIGE